MAVVRVAARRLLNVPVALREIDARHLIVQFEEPAAPSSPRLGGRVDVPQGFECIGRVAVIPVYGCLTHGRAGFASETSYDDVRTGLLEALVSPRIQAIMLHINSLGGEVAGCADLADLIFANRGQKPIWAVLDEMALSAAYWIASACDRVIIQRTGSIGGIGIVAMHIDITGALEKGGIRTTTVKYGARKGNSFPTTKMSDPARERMQAEVDALGDIRQGGRA